MQSRHTWIPTLLFVETLPNTVPANSSKPAHLSGIWHAPYNCRRLWLELVTLDPFLRSWTCHGWEEPKAVAADLTFRCSALHFSFVFTIYKQWQEQFSSSRFCDDIPIIVSVQLRPLSRDLHPLERAGRWSIRNPSGCHNNSNMGVKISHGFKRNLPWHPGKSVRDSLF